LARNRETKIELTAYDDLFQTDESRAEAALSKIRDIPLSEIDEFPDHPFKVLMDEDMEQLVESIKRNGVMTPATQDEMVAIMAKYKQHVEVVPVDYKYSFGNQSDAKTHRNSVQEYLFVGY